MTATAATVLYVYHCTACAHRGQLHLGETAPEVTTACSMCGAEVLAEWDGGVTLAGDQPEQRKREQGFGLVYEKWEAASGRGDHSV